jgi:hypothetical protein
LFSAVDKLVKSIPGLVKFERYQNGGLYFLQKGGVVLSVRPREDRFYVETNFLTNVNILDIVKSCHFTSESVESSKVTINGNILIRLTPNQKVGKSNEVIFELENLSSNKVLVEPVLANGFDTVECHTGQQEIQAAKQKTLAKIVDSQFELKDKPIPSFVKYKDASNDGGENSLAQRAKSKINRLQQELEAAYAVRDKKTMKKLRDGLRY